MFAIYHISNVSIEVEYPKYPFQKSNVQKWVS